MSGIKCKISIALASALLLVLSGAASAALRITDNYSPSSETRPRRKETRYIILHTTEAPFLSSLREVHRYGKCHYLVNTDGHVYRIVDKARVARHCGRSMWDGKAGIDDYSVGIEVVGYHNREIAAAQYSAIAQLLKELKTIYSIPDERVLTHSMVAYGAPNRWHKKSHRGRKRCGMQFARTDVRQRLGLRAKPPFDPDVRARRLVVADPELNDILWGQSQSRTTAASHPSGGVPSASLVITAGRSAWDVAREYAKRPETVYVFPDGTRKRGDEIVRWHAIPPGTQVLLGVSGQACDGEDDSVHEVRSDGVAAVSIAGDEYAAATTIYFMPDGRVVHGDKLEESVLASLPAETKVLVGYVNGGLILPNRSAFDICGDRWNLPGTYFRFPNGALVRGSEVRESAIPRGAMIFFVQ